MSVRLRTATWLKCLSGQYFTIFADKYLLVPKCPESVLQILIVFVLFYGSEPSRCREHNKHVIFVRFLFILIIKTIVIIIIIFTIMCDDEKTEEGGFNKLFARLRFLLRPFLICTILVSDDHHDGDHHYHVHDDDDDDNGKV